MKFSILATVLLATILLFGCTEQIAKPGSVVMTAKASLDQPFSIGVGQTGIITPDNFTINLINISDSRCPSGVQCIRAGEAIAKLKAALKGQSLLIFNLSTSNSSPRFISGYSVTLLSAEPYPMEGKPAKYSDYSITLVISKEPVNSLSVNQQKKISPALDTIINLKNHGGASPDQQASEILSNDKVEFVVEFTHILTPSEIRDLGYSGITFEMLNDEIANTGRFYTVQVPWNQVWEKINTLTALTEVVTIDSTWHPAVTSS